MFFHDFNKARKNIATSYPKVGDKSTSAIHSQTMAKGKLPHLSYIFCKIEPLGTDIKIVAFYVIGALLFVEVQRVKEGINNSKYHLQIVATTVCNKRIMEAKKGISQRGIKGATKDCSLFGSWFYSKKS